MRDGFYDLRFIALDRAHPGSLRVQGMLADGGDPFHVVRGQLSRAGANMLASFEVHLQGLPLTSPDDKPPSYTMRMFGTGTDQTFNLIGIGPLGLIVELQGRWRSPLTSEEEPSAGAPTEEI